MTNLEEKMISTERILDAKIIKARRDIVMSPKGECFREVVEHPGGVAIVAFNSDNKIILTKQWRYATGQALIELPAGKLEPNENPIDSAKRELTEETGYEAKDWELLGYIYSTPGFCNEKIYLYSASNLEFKGTNFDEFELLENMSITLEDAYKMIQNGEIIDSKTICALFHILTRSNL